MKTLRILVTAFAFGAACHVSSGQNIPDTQLHSGQGGQHSDTNNPNLHVNPRWRECSFQLDADLSQNEWQAFAKEAGMVIYFRPLSDAKPMGKRNFEVSLLQWSTAIDEAKGAWNDTFVHPDSTHWLIGGQRLPIFGLTGRVGLTDKLDVGVYFTKAPGANYGFYGAQVQYNVLQNEQHKWSTSIRGGFTRMYGPDDLNLTVYGADIVTSKDFVVHDKWLTLSPYAVLSGYLSAAHEKSEVVDLKDERRIGVQGGVGVVARVAIARIGVEYNQASVNTVSMKIGVAF